MNYLFHAPELMRKIRKVKSKSASASSVPQPWDPQQVVERINRARGDYLKRTGADRSWLDFAKRLRWKPSTQTDVKKGKRPLRISEVAEIARHLDVRPGYLAFGEEPMRGTATTPSVEAETDTFYNRRAKQLGPEPDIPPATPEGDLREGRGTSGG